MVRNYAVLFYVNKIPEGEEAPPDRRPISEKFEASSPTAARMMCEAKYPDCQIINVRG